LHYQLDSENTARPQLEYSWSRVIALDSKRFKPAGVKLPLCRLLQHQKSLQDIASNS
jgi:hypothetical protein